LNNPYFAVGDKIDFTPPSSGAGLQSTKKTLTVTSTTTLQDYMDFMSGTMGIDTAVGANGAAPDGGVTIQAVVPPTATFPANSVQLAVRGNLGLVNNLALSSTDISVTTGSTTNHPFGFDQVTAANGESSSTPVDVYDSLGNHLTLNVTAVLTSRTSSGTAWQYYATSPDGTAGLTTGGLGTQSFVGSGTLNFDNFGNLVNSTTPSLTLNRANTGAVPTLTFTLGFTNTQAFSGGNTQLTVADSDGSLKGTLTGFSIQNDGTVDGAFSNGLHRTLGQVALATFQNNQGLVDAGNNTFVPGANSGLPAISAPGQFSTGTIVAGTLELSNVDLSQEFVNLISASTGFSASSRIITTSNQLLQELLQSAR
jgi:flagellar hook protein FlgE